MDYLLPNGSGLDKTTMDYAKWLFGIKLDMDMKWITWLIGIEFGLVKWA